MYVGSACRAPVTRRQRKRVAGHAASRFFTAFEQLEGTICRLGGLQRQRWRDKRVATEHESTIPLKIFSLFALEFICRKPPVWRLGHRNTAGKVVTLEAHLPYKVSIHLLLRTAVESCGFQYSSATVKETAISVDRKSSESDHEDTAGCCMVCLGGGHILYSVSISPGHCHVLLENPLDVKSVDVSQKNTPGGC